MLNTINNSSLESNSNAIFELYAVKYFFLFNKAMMLSLLYSNTNSNTISITIIIIIVRA